jgi:hypothetical protein
MELRPAEARLEQLEKALRRASLPTSVALDGNEKLKFCAGNLNTPLASTSRGMPTPPPPEIELIAVGRFTIFLFVGTVPPLPWTAV